MTKKERILLAAFVATSMGVWLGAVAMYGPVQYDRTTLYMTPSNALSSNILAGANITITKGANGDLTIAGSAGGGSGISTLNGLGTNTAFYGSNSTTVPLTINSANTNALEVKDSAGNIVGYATTNGYWRGSNDFYATLQTTGVTSGQTNNIWTYTMRTNSTVRVFCEVVSYSVTNGAAYGKVTTFRDIGGVVTTVGSTTSIGTAEDLSIYDCLLNVSANVIQLQVAGSSNSTINWAAYIKLFYATDK